MRNFLAAMLCVCASGAYLSAAVPTQSSPAVMPMELAKYLGSIGIDPESKEIALIYSEGPLVTT